MIEKVVVRYYSEKMFLTVDQNKLLTLVFDVFVSSRISLVPMTKSERSDSSSLDSTGITSVNNRFMIYRRESGKYSRCEDLERRIVAEGAR